VAKDEVRERGHKSATIRIANDRAQG
jgi:hypothetical protein